MQEALETLCQRTSNIKLRRNAYDLNPCNISSSLWVMSNIIFSICIVKLILYLIFMIRIEDKGRNMEKELDNFLKDLPINLSLSPSLMCYKVSLVELELFLEDLCAISFGGGLFLVVSYVSACLSSHAFLEDSLLSSGSMFDPSCHDFEVLNNASNESIVVSIGINGALFDILHDKCLGKFVENVGYVSFFLIFMENHNDFLSCNEQKLSNIINSLSTLFESIFGFQFYHLHFKEILLKDFENHMGTYLDTFLGYVVNFQGLEVGANMMQAIKDCLTSKNSFNERSYHGLTSFHKSFNKELSVLASLLMDVHKKKTGFPWQICLPLIEIAYNQAYYSTILYSSLQGDYGFKLLTSFDLISLSIDLAWSLDQKKKVGFFKHIQSKDHDAIVVNNMKFRMKRLVFDPDG
ncbi:hypothetical protein M9H77_02178 [Catharanthus roseus]|uniref:Uncharacterized protein n=1 Tax=Catharanthus roseus TaxID=4058 RepID=A0ACC0C847_CATRO|nr:hypothetical protein M9H77_02178 [Catharanthus roseus]